MMSSQTHSFSHHYQQLLFSEKNADAFEKCSIRRKCFAQMFKASVPVSNNFTTCILCESNLRKYSEIVNDKSSVNNYAESIKTLLSCSHAESNTWKSSLCSSTMMSQNVSCNSVRTDESDIRFLIGAWKEERNLDKVDGSTSNYTCHKKEEKLPFSIRTSKTSTPCLLEEQKRPMHSTTFDTTVREVAKPNFSSFGVNYVQSSGKNTVDTNITNAYVNHFSASSAKPSSKLMNAQTSYSFQVSNSSLSSNHTNSVFSHSSKEVNIYNNHSAQRSFCTARDELIVQNNKKWSSKGTKPGAECGVVRKCLGSTRRNVMNKFIPPVKHSAGDSSSLLNQPNANQQDNEVQDERLKNIDPKMIESIKNEIMDQGAPVHWDDIAGLQYAKTTIQEIVVWPLLRPEIFTGLRRPPKGILLFGPPGTGKTLIGKCIASQSCSTFFSISASSLTSKWIGDGEKMVRALFAVARCHQPAVVFIDEIDSLLCQRSDTEHESSRRIKTEFLVQLDGATTGEEDRILVVGATNRPQELDEAARRRMVKRLYIPLPDHKARYQIVDRLMSKEQNCLTSEQVNEIALLTEGYSGADVRSLCEEASMGPIRSISFTDIENISPDEVRPISFADFKSALKRVRASVSSCDLEVYLKWNQIYGCN